MGKGKNNPLEWDDSLEELMQASYKFPKHRRRQQPLGGPKKKKKPEDLIVKECLSWWRSKHGAIWRRLFMINNDAAYNKYKGKDNQSKGVVAGTADHMLRLARRGYHGAYIEFKAPGGRQSDNQKIFEQECKEDGYLYVLLKGKTTSEIVLKFKKFIKWYLQE